VDGRAFRVLTVVDQFTRECPLLLVDFLLSGKKVAAALDRLAQKRHLPKAITVDNGSESYSRPMDAWPYQHRVQLEFIRLGRAVENSYIESFNGRLRDECLNVHLFFTLDDAQEKLERWRQDYNHCRPHSSLDDQARVMFAARTVTEYNKGLRESERE
jgi:putative transposase